MLCYICVLFLYSDYLKLAFLPYFKYNVCWNCQCQSNLCRKKFLFAIVNKWQMSFIVKLIVTNTRWVEVSFFLKSKPRNICRTYCKIIFNSDHFRLITVNHMCNLLCLNLPKSDWCHLIIWWLYFCTWARLYSLVKATKCDETCLFGLKLPLFNSYNSYFHLFYVEFQNAFLIKLMIVISFS